MRKHNILIGLIIIVTITLFGCTLNKPQNTLVLNIVAQNCGFLLAQEKPELAQQILSASQYTLYDFEEPIFYEWAASIIKQLQLDPFLHMNFKEMIKLVNIEIELTEDQQEIVKLTYAVIQNFVKGIEAGKQ